MTSGATYWGVPQMVVIMAPGAVFSASPKSATCSAQNARRGDEAAAFVEHENKLVAGSRLIGVQLFTLMSVMSSGLASSRFSSFRSLCATPLRNKQVHVVISVSAT